MRLQGEVGRTVAWEPSGTEPPTTCRTIFARRTRFAKPIPPAAIGFADAAVQTLPCGRMNIAVILPRWVGDACMATPLLRGLRAHWGGAARITGVMRPLLNDLFAGTDWLDAAIPYDRHASNPAVGFRAAARALRALRADVALVLPGSLSAATLAWLGGARRRVGFAGTGHGMLLTDRLALPRSHGRVELLPPPAAYVAIGGVIGLPPQPLDLELATTPADEAAADAALERLYPGPAGRAGPLIVLNDNSSNGTARAWGVGNHAALARWFVERVPAARVLVHCGPADRELARAIVTEAASPAVRGLADIDDLPLGLSKAIYRRADLAVSSDSGPRHLGAAFRVPTVALLGPIDPRLGRSDERGCVEIRLDLPCSPCGAAVCPLVHHDCMRLITVGQVGRAALDLLAGRSAARGPGAAG